MTKTTRELLDLRFGSLKTARSEREDEWRQVQRFVAPRRGRFNPGDKTSGRDKHRSVLNNVASRAARTCAHGLASNVISPAYPWFRIGPDDPDLAEFGTVRKWLDQLQGKVSAILFDSGFYPAATVELFELVCFGTCALGQERDYETVARWHPWTIGEYYVATDHKGRPSTVYREIEITTEAAIGWFGPRCSQAVRTNYDQGNLEAKVKIRQAIEPVGARVKDLPHLGRWKYASMYWDPADAGPDRNKFLLIGGSNTCQAHVTRWEHVPPDAYGNSPAMEALDSVKELQQARKRLAQGIGNKMAPALQGPSFSGLNGVSNPFDASPLSYNPVQGLLEIKPLIDPRAIQLSDGQWYHEKLEQEIQETFFVDLFRMLDLMDRKEITATEVMERQQEKLLQLGPVLTNLNSELLNPVINGLVEEVFRASEPMWHRGEPGMLPVPPQELQGRELKVDYISTLQQAQQAVKAGPINRLTSFVGGYAQLHPEIMDKIDWDQAVDELGQAWGVAPTVVLDDATVAQTRMARAQQQAEAQQQQQVLQQAEIASKLGGAKVTQDTALGRLEGATPAGNA